MNVKNTRAVRTAAREALAVHQNPQRIPLVYAGISAAVLQNPLSPNTAPLLITSDEADLSNHSSVSNVKIALFDIKSYDFPS